MAQLESDLSSGGQRQSDAKAQLEESRADLRRAREDVTAAGNMIAGYSLRQNTRIKRRDELADQLKLLLSQWNAVAAKAKVFRDMERDFDSFNKSVKTVMQEAQRGTLKNIHGPVSRLIQTGDEYTVAIEIALGGALQQIVVSSEQDGKAAIQFLKRSGGGRATFLPLSTIEGRRLSENGLEGCRGFVGIASDLVKSEQRYRGIVENLLGRTVIATDIDAAIAMAGKYHNRFKIVTLDGQVMNAGGSMTGGSVSKETGILSRANELEKLTAREKELSEQKQELEMQLQEAQRAADQVQFQLDTARDQLQEAQNQVLRLEGVEKQHEILCNAITEAIENAQREQQSLQQRRASDRERLVAQETKIQLFTQQLNQTRQQILLLEDSQSEATAASSRLGDAITAEKAEEAALLAERTTANAHVADLQNLQSAMAGDRDRQLALIQQIKAENSRIEAEIAELLQRQQENDGEANSFRTQLRQLQEARANAEATKTRAEREAQEKSKDIMNMERACASLEHKKEVTALEEKQIIDKLWESYGLTPGTAPQHRGQIESVTAGNRRIAELRRKIGTLGTPNLGAIEEYARVNERYTYLTGQRDDVLTSKRELENIIRSITQQMTTIFVSEFEKIDRYFGQTFEEMFGGGKGQLILEDPSNPLTCGIEIRVQPPGKQVKTITLLSGGEKAFVAIALYFAILKVRPTPFCMLDEIDAALDDRNVERFASYLHNLSKKTQFIVITHRRGTMEASDVLYGVTMQEQGVSKLLRLDLNQMEQYLGIVE
jgi:chromosome segregation protein